MGRWFVNIVWLGVVDLVGFVVFFFGLVGYYIVFVEKDIMLFVNVFFVVVFSVVIGGNEKNLCVVDGSGEWDWKWFDCCVGGVCFVSCIIVEMMF